MANIPIINNLRIVPRDEDFLNRKIGSRGEIYFDRDTKTLRLYDGDTLGGIQLAKADLTNVSDAIFLTKAESAGIGAGSGGNTTVTVGSALPNSPENGNLWLNTNNGNLYVYINDGDSAQWIQPSNPVGPKFISAYDNDVGYTTAFDPVVGIDSTVLVDTLNSRLNTSALSQNSATNGQYLIWNDALSSWEPNDFPSIITSSIVSDDSVSLIDTVTGSINTHQLAQVSAGEGQALVWSASNQRWEPGDVAPSTGNFTFTGSTIDTEDSSAVTVTTALIAESNLTVENNLFVNNDISAGKITASSAVIAESFSSAGAGIPLIESATAVTIRAPEGTRIE